jgi:hypothetical protein
MEALTANGFTVPLTGAAGGVAGANGSGGCTCGLTTNISCPVHGIRYDSWTYTQQVPYSTEKWGFCPSDGHKLDTNWKYCPSCGRAIGTMQTTWPQIVLYNGTHNQGAD